MIKLQLTEYLREIITNKTNTLKEAQDVEEFMGNIASDEKIQFGCIVF